MRRSTIALSALLSLPILLHHPSTARADEPVGPTRATISESTPATTAVDRRWYGWQPIMTDVGSIGVGSPGTELEFAL